MVCYVYYVIYSFEYSPDRIIFSSEYISTLSISVIILSASNASSANIALTFGLFFLKVTSFESSSLSSLSSDVGVKVVIVPY